jgi:hypothetical protein
MANFVLFFNCDPLYLILSSCLGFFRSGAITGDVTMSLCVCCSPERMLKLKQKSTTLLLRRHPGCGCCCGVRQRSHESLGWSGVTLGKILKEASWLCEGWNLLLGAPGHWRWDQRVEAPGEHTWLASWFIWSHCLTCPPRRRTGSSFGVPRPPPWRHWLLSSEQRELLKVVVRRSIDKCKE